MEITKYLYLRNINFKMKYLIIPFISLGFILSLTIGIEYNYSGEEIFPTYYGSPFIFKEKSLGSSMEYYYSISGMVLNILIWSLILFFINYVIQKFISNKTVKILYSIFIGILILFSSLIIAGESQMIGRGFNKYANYWYWNVDKDAKNWEVTRNSEIIFFRP